MPESGYLKLPVTLTKVTSKTGQDHELMWQITVETHSKNAKEIQTLVPFVTKPFVMFLVKVDNAEELREAMKNEEIDVEGLGCQKEEQQKPRKSSRQKRK